MKIAKLGKLAEILEDYLVNPNERNEDAVAEILALIPANMEVPEVKPGIGFMTLERRNLILGRNAGLDECRKAMEGE